MLRRSIRSLFHPLLTCAFCLSFKAFHLCAADSGPSPDPYAREAELRIANFTFPEDLKIDLFADQTQVINPSAICFDDKGRLYVAEIHRWRAGVDDIRNEQHMLFDDLASRTNADRLRMFEKHAKKRPLSYYTEFDDRIVMVEDRDNDGRADQSSVYASGFNDPLDGPGIGLLYGEGKIYYTNIPHLWRLEDADADGRAEKRDSLQDGFGVRMSLSGHDMHGLIWGPDGRLYWSIGDRGYNVTTKEGKNYFAPMRGAVFRCDPDGSNLEEYYRGLRNPQELAFDKFGNLFTCDNDADQWDKGRLVYVLEGGDSGWSAGHQSLLNFRDQLGVRTPLYRFQDHDKEISLEPWMTEGLWEPRHEDQPAWILPCVDNVSWGPSGLVYNYGGTAFPERYADHFFVCNFGGANGDLEAFAVEPAGGGFTSKNVHEFMVGLGNTDVEFGPDGKMYLCCFNNNGWVKQDIGNIYTIFSPDHLESRLVLQTRQLLSLDFTQVTSADLDGLLGHPDLRVRQKAQFTLAKRRKEAPAIFTEAARDGESLLTRLHGIWGLWQLGRKDPSACDPLLAILSQEEPEEEVRAQCAKVLGDIAHPRAGKLLAELLLKDPSTRVRTFAAIGIGRAGYGRGFQSLVLALRSNDNRDAYLRHACVMGLYYLNQRDLALSLAFHDSNAVRMGAALAFRRWKDPRIGRFLDDKDIAIRHEAIRAVNDLNIEESIPQLAQYLERFTTPLEYREPLPKTARDFIIHTRLINANLRLGDKSHARRLLTYANNGDLPEMLRRQALKAIKEWDSPRVIDATVGIHRPVKGARPDIKSEVHRQMPTILDSADGSLLATAIRLAGIYNYGIPDEVLLQQLARPDNITEVRTESLRQLAGRKHDALVAMFPALLKDTDAVIRAETCRALLLFDRAAGIDAALALLRDGQVIDRQHAYALLGEIGSHPKIVEELIAGIDRLLKDSEPAGSRLDLIEACEARTEPAIREKLAAWRAALDPTDLLAPFRIALSGGHAAAGKKIFDTHAAGQCLKCHKAGEDGGVAGPDLTGVGARVQPDYLLESLVNPTAVIAPGYGLTLVTMKDGSSLGGNLLEETDTHIDLKLPEGTIRKISLSEIDNRLPPVSAMPPMGALLTRREIRDLIAYLSSLEGAAGEDPAAHGAE